VLEQPERSGTLAIARGGGEPFTEMPLTLDSSGEATITIPGVETATWDDGFYWIEITVNGETSIQKDRTGVGMFHSSPSLDITPTKTAYLGYDPLVLSLEMSPILSDVELRVHCWDDLLFETSYSATYDGIDLSTLEVQVPCPSPSDTSWHYGASVSMDVLLQWGEGSVSYSVGSVDTDGDWLPDPVEESVGSDVSSYDTDGDQQYDGLEWYYGFDPTDPGSMIPELHVMAIAATPFLCLAVYLYRKRLLAT